MNLESLQVRHPSDLEGYNDLKMRKSRYYTGSVGLAETVRALWIYSGTYHNGTSSMSFFRGFDWQFRPFTPPSVMVVLGVVFQKK